MSKGRDLWVAAPSALAAPASGFATFEVRGQRVVLDRDLARLLGVETKRLNQQLRRNLDRFAGYAFQLEDRELEILRLQNVTSSSGWGGRRSLPWAFTEHGVVMAATILNSDAALNAMRWWSRPSCPPAGPGRSSARRRALGLGGQQTLERLLDTIVDHRAQTTLREEAQELIAQSIQHLKDRLGRPGLENEEIAARAAKLLAEAELGKATAAKSQAEAGEIELRLLARRLRLLVEAELAFAAGQTDAFLTVLEDLGRHG